jgi:hypothetical protein
MWFYYNGFIHFAGEREREGGCVCVCVCCEEGGRERLVVVGACEGLVADELVWGTGREGNKCAQRERLNLFNCFFIVKKDDTLTSIDFILLLLSFPSFLPPPISLRALCIFVCVCLTLPSLSLFLSFSFSLSLPLILSLPPSLSPSLPLCLSVRSVEASQYL